MSRFEYITGVTTDETTSHSATPPINSGQAAGYSHLMWLMALLLSAFVAGCSDGGGSDLIVAAGSAPTVTAVAPLPNAIVVPINTKIITAAFTKAMDPATLTPASFTLACPAGTPITGTVSYLAASNLAMLTLPDAAHLPPNTLCTATVTAGARDTTGIPLASNFVWNFTTGTTMDFSAPTVTGTIHANGATNVPINTKVGATFSEGMDPLTITTTTFTLKQGTTVVPGTLTYTGVSAVFVPAGNLAASTTYTATVTTGAKSAEGNALASDFTWSWTTAATLDTTAPTVTNTIHANGATNVPINTKVGATFSEGMDPLTINNVNFTLKETVSGNPVAGVVSYSGVSALFIPLNNLAPATRYTVTLKGGVSGAKSLEGNPLASDFVISWTTAAAPDTTAPTVTHTIHANGATNVPINTKIGVTFSEGMDPLTINNVNLTLKETVSGNPVAGTVSYSGLSATFIPWSNLTSSTGYTVTIRGGVGGVTDLADNPLASDFVISWTTGAAIDTTAPTVTEAIHANGQTNVPINTKIGITFSEGMYPLTVNNVNFTLKETVTGTAVMGTVNLSGVSATFIPWINLAPNTGYTVTVKGGASGASDLAGNPLASDFVITWTTAATADTIAPTVTGTLHANGQTNVPINTKVGITFSEGMDPLTITNVGFTLKETVAGTAVTGTVSYSGVSAVFVPSNNLSPSTGYTVTVNGGVGGVTDLANNALASDFVIRWTTSAAGDFTAPMVTHTIQANGATNVDFNTKVGATFSEGMDPLTINNVNFTLKETVTNTAVIGTVSYSGVNAVFRPLSNLAPNTGYTVTVKGGVGGVTDLSGNALASDYVWNWTTSAVSYNITPTVISVHPVDHEINVPINDAVSVTFSEAMDPLTINSANFTVSGVTGTVTYDARYKVATFKPLSDLTINTTYTATITTAATDLVGNALSVNKIWSLTTADYPLLSTVINLGSASSFGAFGGSSGITNSGLHTVINGDIGTTAASTAVTGFHDAGSGCIYTETPLNIGALNGAIYTAAPPPTAGCPNEGTVATFAIATQARADALSAYNALVAMPAGANLTLMPVGSFPPVNLAGFSPLPGTWTAPTGAWMIQGGDLTLDANGDTDAVWVFQMATSLTVGGPGATAPQSVILTGGAQAKNVFWQVGTVATINAAGGGTMAGTIISQEGATFSSGGNGAAVMLEGRVLSLNGPVTLTNTVINVPSP